MTGWGNLPPALPPHGTVLAWARGCRCEECERQYQRLVSELALRGPLRLPAQPEPRKLDADTLARLEPAVSQSECPVCGALRHQRCRNLAFPPPADGPCLADEPADRDDGVGKVEERLDDVLVALVAALQQVKGVGPLDAAGPGLLGGFTPARARLGTVGAVGSLGWCPAGPGR
jgi:hypothetical protein